MSNKKRIGLIASGTYISDGLSAELGPVPSCLVPLGNTLLLYEQYFSIRDLVDRVFVSLPEGFDLQPIDRDRIESLEINIVYCDPTLSIGESINNAINSIGIYDHELIILYGDTIISGLEVFPSDAASVHSGWGEYKWADLKKIFSSRADKYEDLTLSGLFSFSNTAKLLRSIVCAKGDFLAAIRAYNGFAEMQLINSGDWYDFGHVQTYFQSTGLVTTQRSFNRVQINKRDVIKASCNDRKIKAEASWFSDIPKHIAAFTPTFLGERQIDGLSGYATTNTYLSTLANLAVFGNLKINTWNNIFEACGEFIHECRRVTPLEPLHLSADSYFGNKTMERIEEFSRSLNGSVMLSCQMIDGQAVPPITEILDTANGLISKSIHGPECLIHGDLCFSNIFFDFRSASIKVIDPRGELPDGTRSVFGLQSYDIAKLAHSIIGGYDLIIANYIQCDIIGNKMMTETSFLESKRWLELREAFLASNIVAGYNTQQLNAMVVHLLLSMLPLHADRPDRQAAMLAMSYKFHNKIAN